MLHHRLERLACDFPIAENYFAWQGFGRRYPTGSDKGLPPYLQSRHFDAVRARADRVGYHQQSMTGFLAAQANESVDAFVLLDAQDWMGDGRPRFALDGDRPHRCAGRPGHLPHRRATSGCCRAGCPRAFSPPGRPTRRSVAPGATATAPRSTGAFHLYRHAA